MKAVLLASELLLAIAVTFSATSAINDVISSVIVNGGIYILYLLFLFRLYYKYFSLIRFWLVAIYYVLTSLSLQRYKYFLRNVWFNKKNLYFILQNVTTHRRTGAPLRLLLYMIGMVYIYFYIIYIIIYIIYIISLWMVCYYEKC